MRGLAEGWEEGGLFMIWSGIWVVSVVGSSGAHFSKLPTGIREFCYGIVLYDMMHHIVPDQKYGSRTRPGGYWKLDKQPAY